MEGKCKNSQRTEIALAHTKIGEDLLIAGVLSNAVLSFYRQQARVLLD